MPFPSPGDLPDLGIEPESPPLKDFPGDSDGKEFSCHAGDLGSIPESERSPGDGNGNSLQYSCLENSRDRGSWLAIVRGLVKSQIYLTV